MDHSGDWYVTLPRQSFSDLTTAVSQLKGHEEIERFATCFMYGQDPGKLSLGPEVSHDTQYIRCRGGHTMSRKGNSSHSVHIDWNRHMLVDGVCCGCSSGRMVK